MGLHDYQCIAMALPPRNGTAPSMRLARYCHGTASKTHGTAMKAHGSVMVMPRHFMASMPWLWLCRGMGHGTRHGPPQGHTATDVGLWVGFGLA